MYLDEPDGKLGVERARTRSCCCSCLYECSRCRNDSLSDAPLPSDRWSGGGSARVTDGQRDDRREKIAFHPFVRRSASGWYLMILGAADELNTSEADGDLQRVAARGA
jgi:hypothetical protein